MFTYSFAVWAASHLVGVAFRKDRSAAFLEMESLTNALIELRASCWSHVAVDSVQFLCFPFRAKDHRKSLPISFWCKFNAALNHLERTEGFLASSGKRRCVKRGRALVQASPHTPSHTAAHEKLSRDEIGSQRVVLPWLMAVSHQKRWASALFIAGDFWLCWLWSSEGTSEYFHSNLLDLTPLRRGTPSAVYCGVPWLGNELKTACGGCVRTVSWHVRRARTCYRGGLNVELTQHPVDAHSGAGNRLQKNYIVFCPHTSPLSLFSHCTAWVIKLYSTLQYQSPAHYINQKPIPIM